MRLRQLSSVLGDTRELIVHLPERYDEEPTRRYPVIYVLNGSSQDVHTASTAALMARLGLMPELIVVGVPNISEKVVIVSESLAQRMFLNQDAVNRRFFWTDPVMEFINVSTGPRCIVGVAADIDDENVVPGPAMTVYHPMDQEIGGGRLFVHARTDPYALVPPITRIIRDLSSEQPVEQAATLEDVRAEVLAPNRLNALVFSGFAGVALMIAIVGVAGVLAFSVSARTREFGVRLAIGSTPRHLLTGVLGEGAMIASVGVIAGAAGGFLLARTVSAYLAEVNIPGVLPLLAAATVLVAAAILASALPAARAARVDVMQALRTE